MYTHVWLNYEGCETRSYIAVDPHKFGFVGAYTVNSYCQEDAQGDWLTRTPESPSADPVVN